MIKPLHPALGVAAALAVAHAAAAGPVERQAERERQHGMTAPTAELLRDVLGEVAPEFVEVERPVFIHRTPRDRPLSGVRFATRPSGVAAGLCSATVIQVNLPGAYRYRGPIVSSEVFKVVGDPEEPSEGLTDSYLAELERKCAKAGRVVAEGDDDLGGDRFFTLDDYVVSWGASNSASTAVRVLQRVIVPVKGQPAPVCAPTEVKRHDDCADAAATAASLKLKDLFAAGIHPCEDKPGLTCVTGSFLMLAEANYRESWELVVQARVGKDDGPIEIVSASVEHVGTVYH